MEERERAREGRGEDGREGRVERAGGRGGRGEGRGREGGKREAYPRMATWRSESLMSVLLRCRWGERASERAPVM